MSEAVELNAKAIEASISALTYFEDGKRDFILAPLLKALKRLKAKRSERFEIRIERISEKTSEDARPTAQPTRRKG